MGMVLYYWRALGQGVKEAKLTSPGLPRGKSRNRTGSTAWPTVAVAPLVDAA